jgi:hypothetical protein
VNVDKFRFKIGKKMDIGLPYSDILWSNSKYVRKDNFKKHNKKTPHKLGRGGIP